MLDKEKTKEELIKELKHFKSVKKFLLVGSKELFNKFQDIIESPSVSGLNYEFKEDNMYPHYFSVVDLSDVTNPKQIYYLHLEKSIYQIIFKLIKGENVHQVKDALNQIIRDIDRKSTID